MEDHQATLLWISVESGDKAGVCELLNTGSFPTTFVDEEGNTLLHTASASGHTEVVKCLLERNFDMNARSFYRWTPLMQASAYGHHDVVKVLLEAGADINAVNVMGASALVCAARGGYTPVVTALLKAGASISNEQGAITPLMMSCVAGHESVCRVLLGSNADPDARHEDTGWTPLMHAALNGYLNIVQVLVAHKCDVNAMNAKRMMALDVAVSQGHTNVETFLSKHADSSILTSRKLASRLDIFEATQAGDYEQVQAAIEVKKSLVNKKDSEGATCLMFAAMRGHLAIAELLVDNGARVDSQDDKSGWTALMFATYYGHKSIARLMIDSGANISLQAYNGCTAFDIASIIGDTEVVRLIAAVSMRGGKKRSTNIDTPSFADIHPRILSSNDQQHDDNPLRPPLNITDTDIPTHSPARGGSGGKRQPRFQKPGDDDEQPNNKLFQGKRDSVNNMNSPHTGAGYKQPSGENKKRVSWFSKIFSFFRRKKKSKVRTLALAPKRKSTFEEDTKPRKPGFPRSISGTSLTTPSAAPPGKSNSQQQQETSPAPPPWRQQGGLIGARPNGPRGGADTPDFDQNENAPLGKLPADIMAPIKPPFMPPPAFELSHIERPKFERPSQRALPEVSPASSNTLTQRPPSFVRPDRQQSWALPRKPVKRLPRAGKRGSSMSNQDSPSESPSRSRFMKKRTGAKVSFVTPPPSGSVSSSKDHWESENPSSGPSSEAETDFDVDLDGSSAEQQQKKSSSETTVDLQEVLKQNDLEGVYEILNQQEIDLEAFVTLDDSDMIELGIDEEQTRKKIGGLIQTLKSKSKVDAMITEFRRLSVNSKA